MHHVKKKKAEKKLNIVEQQTNFNFSC